MPKHKNTTHRNQSVKVKTAKGRKISSTLWLQRQLNDPFTIRAKSDGYASRAAYKLLEIDAKFHILGHGKIIIDLGSAPGSWTQVALKTEPRKIIAVDLVQMKELTGVQFILGDFTDEATLKKIYSALANTTIPSNILANTELQHFRHPHGRGDDEAGGINDDEKCKVDIILSDMAPNTSGHRDLDHLKIIDLGEHALEFAKKTLSKDGALIMKTFQGGGEKQLAEKLKKSFSQVKFFKPGASRKDSSEIFLVAIGFLS
jgi:23S rRNA (uridine2552-2'-O)-methyltransferase